MVSSTKCREYENEKNVQLAKLHGIFDVLVHVWKMIDDRQFRAQLRTNSRWAQLAVSSQRFDFSPSPLLKNDFRAWLELFLGEAEYLDPRYIAALCAIFAHSLKHMTKQLNIYDKWTHNSLKFSYQQKLDEDQSADLLEFWCDTRPTGNQRRELIERSIRTENPAAALGYFFNQLRQDCRS